MKICQAGKGYFSRQRESVTCALRGRYRTPAHHHFRIFAQPHFASSPSDFVACLSERALPACCVRHSSERSVQEISGGPGDSRL